MAETDQDILLGRLAVHYEFLTKEQAREAIRLWRSTQGGKELGDFLVAESYLPPDALPKLLRVRADYLRRQKEKAAASAPQPAAPARVAPEPAMPEPALDAPVGAATVRLTPEVLAAAAASQPAAPEPAAPEPAAPEPAAPEPAAPEPAAPEPAAPEPAAPEPAAPEPAAPEPAVPVPAAPEPAGLELEAIPVEPSKSAEADAIPADLAPVSNLIFAEPIPADLAPEPVMNLVAPEPLDTLPTPTKAAVGPGVEAAAPEPAAPEPAAPEPAAPEPAAPEPAAPEPAPPAAGAVSTGAANLGYRPEATLEDLLRRASELGASDLHVHSGAPLKVRLHGVLQDASESIDREAAKALLYGVLSEEQQARLEEHLQLDFSFAIPGVGRFRANSYFQHRGLDGVFRLISLEPPTLEQLGLPQSLGRFSEYHQGMVLFTGPAGCGKSSTMAALVRMINQGRPEHILSIEDPIEYVHTPQRCVVNQREVGPHTESFVRALRGALREDPDIIVIGEMRDLETVSLALTAAETGHLVLGTLHTASTIPTINRLVGVFPPDQQAQIRTMVSESLRAIVSQRLVRRADGSGRVAALEILVNNKAVGNLVRDNRTFQIKSVLQTGGAQGMCELDSSLADLVKDGLITPDAARREAIDPKRFA